MPDTICTAWRFRGLTVAATLKQNSSNVGQGQPLIDAGQLNQYVHDAGFTPRWIRVELTGRFARTGDKLMFEVAETGEQLPVREDSETTVTGRDLGPLMRLKARGLEHKEAAFQLSAVTLRALERNHC